jgi:DNA polymerase III delta prime subunit
MLSIHKNIEEKLNSFVEHNKIPNIIFYGENGSGKKTILKNFLNNIYKSSDIQKEYVMYVNCAFGKGIKFIREELKFFAKTNINSNNKFFKSIILLDCELLTTDAQSALRRCIELFSKNTRFFIVVNDKDRLLKPIVSRFCSIFIPLPLVDNKITNLHIYNKNSLDKNLYNCDNNIIKKYLKLCDDEIPSKNIMDISLELYEKGISYYSLEKYIERNLPDSKEKCFILIILAKFKQYNKNDKLLINQLLNLYKIRKYITLENIFTM